MMLRKAVSENSGCDGVVLGGHGLFTWGQTQRECYENTISVIDQLGQFVLDHVARKGSDLFGGVRHHNCSTTIASWLSIFFPSCADASPAIAR